MFLLNTNRQVLLLGVVDWLDIHYYRMITRTNWLNPVKGIHGFRFFMYTFSISDTTVDVPNHILGNCRVADVC